MVMCDELAIKEDVMTGPMTAVLPDFFQPDTLEDPIRWYSQAHAGAPIVRLADGTHLVLYLRFGARGGGSSAGFFQRLRLAHERCAHG
jgi:hypothetical protein